MGLVDSINIRGRPLIEQRKDKFFPHDGLTLKNLHAEGNRVKHRIAQYIESEGFLNHMHCYSILKDRN